MPRDPLQRDRSPLLWLVLPFAGGIAVSHMIAREQIMPVWLGIALVALALGSWAMNAHPRIWRGALLVAVMAAGATHYELQRNRLPEWDDLPQREAELTVAITRVFSAHPTDRYLNFLGVVREAAYPATELKEQRLHVRIRRPDAAAAILRRGAEIRVIGQLEHLDAAEHEDDFLNYLFDSGHNFRLRQARWLETTVTPSIYANHRDGLRDRGIEILSAELDHRPRLAAALCAMLLGQRHQLSEQDRTLFLRSGTMHLFAISGLHIGAIAAIINGLLRLTPLPRPCAYGIGSVLLLGYVDLIGLTPSAVRAWIMITCYLAARVGRAPGNPVAALATSALIVLLIDPLQLFSAGFQMSYTIVFALLLHGLPLGASLSQRSRPWRDLPRLSLNPLQRWLQQRWEIIVTTAALTWSASLIGVISSVGIFGWFTPFAFVANLFLVPLAGFVIAAGFSSLIFGGLGLSPIALLFNHAGALLLWLMYGLLERVLQPLAGRAAGFWQPWWGEFGIVAVFTAMVVVNELGPAAGRWRWWAPTAITMLVLVTGLRLA